MAGSASGRQHVSIRPASGRDPILLSQLPDRKLGRPRTALPSARLDRVVDGRIRARALRDAQKKNGDLLIAVFEFGAGNETRTRDPNLGKVVLYQLSYSR